MPKQKDAKVDEALALYRQGLKLVEIAEKLDKPVGTIRRWKHDYHWDGESERSENNANVRKAKAEKKRKTIKSEVDQVMENSELNDQQRLFCLYQVRYFNATKAYQKAYGCSYDTAHAHGYKLLQNVAIQEEIKRLKRNRMNRELLEPEDIFQKFMDIAFADYTDYMEFGREEVPVMGASGPIYEKDPESGEKIPITKMANYVKFREHTDVDGTLISEVRTGRDGAIIKLADRMKALEWLADHMDMASEEQKLKLEILKSKIGGRNDDDGAEVEIYIPDNGRRRGEE